MEEIVGKIDSIIFSNVHTGFYILKTKVADKNIVIKGTFPGANLSIGLKVKFNGGEFEEHPTYGQQFHAQTCEVIPEKGRNGIITYLANNIPSIGPITAAKLYNAFGDDLVNMLNEHPEEVAKLDFLTSIQSKIIVEEWKKSNETRTAALFLADLGLNSAQIKSVYTIFGGTTISIVKENPYNLYGCPGVGFQTADTAACKLGIEADDIRRVHALILFVIDDLARSEGHMYCTSDQILEHASKIFARYKLEPFVHGEYVSQSDLYSSINFLKEAGHIHVHNDRIYLYDNWIYESESAECMAEIIRCGSKSLGNLNEILQKFESTRNLILSDEQRNAFFLLEKSRICVVSGYPGTGKTLLISAFVHLFEENNLNYILLSPTGIAAKRLSQMTGRPAFTIHRALGYGYGGEWEFNRGNKYHVDAVIVDEMCLPYKQFVNLADGSKKYIGTIVNSKEQVEVLSYNKKTKKIEPKVVTNWFKYERKNELYKIVLSKTLSHNRTRILRCTGKHKVYMDSGLLKRASDINKEDRVIIHGRFLNSFQESFLLGSLLGDSSISKYGKNKQSCNIRFVHGQLQEDYLKFKANLFHSSIRKCRGGFNKNKFLWTSTTLKIDGLEDIKDLLYLNGRKTITKTWLDRIDAIGLAAWYMDDGQLSKTKTKRSKNPSICAYLHTEGFSKIECRIIVDWLRDKWAVNGSVYRNGSRGHYYIRLTCASSIKFFDIIRPYIIDSMSYKIQGKVGYKIPEFLPYNDTGSYYVQSISTYTPNDQYSKYVYDIEVKDNHNYFSNNILVSNSMVDGNTLYHLISSLSHETILIFVGDPAQLPSVGAGYVLHNLMLNPIIPHVSLTQIYRQEGESDIIKIAHAILSGRDIDISFKKDSEVVFLNFEKNKVIDEMCKITSLMRNNQSNFQVIAPKYDGDLGVNNLNRKLREVLNTQYSANKAAKIKHGACDLYEGDRIMVIKNDYDRMIYNGDVGKVHRISIRDDEVEVRIFNWFDYESGTPRYIDKIFTFNIEEARSVLKVAYACTAHRTQGQEFDFVLLPMTMQYGYMLYRNLIYTALTRAKKKAFIFGDSRAFLFAVNNIRETVRNSSLSDLISECISECTDQSEN